MPALPPRLRGGTPLLRQTADGRDRKVRAYGQHQGGVRVALRGADQEGQSSLPERGSEDHQVAHGERVGCLHADKGGNV